MAAQQTSYSLEHVNAYEGDLYDTRPHTVIALRNATGAEVAFGRVVALDASDSDAFLACANGRVVAGILVQEHDQEVTATGLKSNSYGNVVADGIVWVRAEDAVTPASSVFVRVSGGGGAGVVRGTDDSTNAFALSGARFLKSAGAGELVPLLIKLSGPQVIAA